MKTLACVVLLLAAGCQMSPVPKAIREWHDEAVRVVPPIESVLKPGDIVFRLSNTQLVGGLIDFSEVIAKSTQSNMSHAALIRSVGPEGAIIADVTPTGVARRYLVDWWVDGTKNVMICRLKPEYQYLIPDVLAELDRMIAKHVLYDEKFDPKNDRYYCTELVDHCFRAIGHPLAPLIQIKDLPVYNVILRAGCLFGGINIRNEVAIVGNEHIGLLSSPMLEVVLDLRGKSPDQMEQMLPEVRLVDERHGERETPIDHALPVNDHVTAASGG